MNQNVQKLMLSRFIALYGAPVSEDLEMFYEEYHKALKGFTVEALQHGADKVISHHRFQSWPTVGECYASCESYKPPRRAESRDEYEARMAVALSAPQAKANPEHIAETNRMWAEIRANILTNTSGSAGKTKTYDRTYFENRPGWTVPGRAASLKGTLKDSLRKGPKGGAA